MPYAHKAHRERLRERAEIQLARLSEPILGLDPMSDVEQYAALKALVRFRGNTVVAADFLGISVRKLQYRLKEWGIHNEAIHAAQHPAR